MVLVNNPGSSPTYAPLEHAEWHGWTFTDTVFPFFLWIVGVALTLSTAKRRERGEDRGALLGHTFRRALILYGIGFLFALLPGMHWDRVRILGVLQRIAICYFIAMLLFLWTSWKGQLVAFFGLNAVYLALMFFYPVPGCGGGSFSMDCNFERYIDSMVLGAHTWSHTKYWDPEGIVSTLPAISTAIAGVLAGHLLRAITDPWTRIRSFAGIGLITFVAGEAFSLVMPVNKNLWSTSFVLVMAGLAMMWFAFWYWIGDVQGWGKWFEPLRILGLNAILVYILAGVAARVLGSTGIAPWFYDHVCAPAASQMNASLLFAISFDLLMLLFAWIAYRQRWFLKF